MKVRPLHDWTIIKRHAPKEKTVNGIIIPDSAQDIPSEGTVVAVGPGRYKKEPGKKTRFISTILKPGQKVYFMEYATQEIELEGNEILFIKEEDVLGIFEDDKQLMVKEPHPIEAKQDQPLIPHAKAETPSIVPDRMEEIKKKKPSSKKKTPAKKRRVKKEQAVSRSHKPAIKKKSEVTKKTTKKKTTKPAKKVPLKKPGKKTAKKALKKKTPSWTKKKTKTAKKSIKRVTWKPAKGKKTALKKKSIKGPLKRKR